MFTQLKGAPWEPGDAVQPSAPRAAGKGGGNVMVNFMRQLGCTTVPRHLVQHYS